MANGVVSDPFWFIRIFRALGGIEYPYPQQIELGTTIHLALNQFQAVKSRPITVLP
jgi:hypothetical protein